MPHAYKFTFSHEPIGEDELLAKFLERHKQVEYRDVVNGVTALFGIGAMNTSVPKKGCFEEAWQCMSKSKCPMCFENSWSKHDYESILPKDVVDTLIQGINFGTMFVCNLKKKPRTAGLHATSTQ